MAQIALPGLGGVSVTAAHAAAFAARRALGDTYQEAWARAGLPGAYPTRVGAVPVPQVTLPYFPPGVPSDTPMKTLGAASPLGSYAPGSTMANQFTPPFGFDFSPYSSPTFNPYSSPAYTPSGGSSPTQNLCIQGCQLLPAAARPLCIAACGFIPSGGGGGGGMGMVPSCAPGYVLNSAGQCVVAGVGGMMERMLPGGSTGTMLPGQAQMGAFGIPAETPAQVGTILRNDGSTGPVFRCRGNLVLGKDNLCYARGSIPRSARKHPPGRKPLLTGGDLKCLTKAQGLRGKIKRAARGAKLFVADRPPQKGPKPRRR